MSQIDTKTSQMVIPTDDLLSHLPRKLPIRQFDVKLQSLVMRLTKSTLSLGTFTDTVAKITFH